MHPKWKTTQFFRMWPRALFHMKEGKPIVERHFGKIAGVYVLYRDDVPFTSARREELCSEGCAIMH